MKSKQTLKALPALLSQNLSHDSHLVISCQCPCIVQQIIMTLKFPYKLMKFIFR